MKSAFDGGSVVPDDCTLLIPSELITFPTLRTVEAWRWYADGGATALALSTGGTLLEPHPTFGPSEYRLLALNVTSEEANTYAHRHGFVHMRALPPQCELRQ
jgi:hypothetical protein